VAADCIRHAKFKSICMADAIRRHDALAPLYVAANIIARSNSQFSDKIFCRDARLFQNAGKSPHFDFLVVRDDTS